MSAAGQVLNGRYRMERQVGSGGFAEVYLATDLGPLGRQVAVKLLHAHLVQQRDFLARFKQEAAVLAQLKHPHILDVYDFGEAGGTIYLVMPYIPGGTLDDLLRSARHLDPVRVARYLQQIASALDYAHSRRIVHRDLKPGNFLLDEGETVKLSDFGIAKLLQEATQAYSGMGIMGTLPYMAPESFRGQTGPATDIYALGCIVFQLLTGATPYTGTTEQVMFAHSFEPIPSLVERAGGRVPSSLGPILERALAKRPEDRYATAGEFARAFDAVVRATPTVAMPPPAQDPTMLSYSQPTYAAQQPVPSPAPPLPRALYGAPTQLGAPGQPAYGAPVPPIITPPAYGQQQEQTTTTTKRRWLVWLIAGGASAAVVSCLALIVVIVLLSQPRSPQEKARATATAQVSSGSAVFGPQSGTLAHNPNNTSVSVFAAGSTSLRDFAADVTFFNPYAASAGNFDYGYIFRSTKGGSEYRLVIRSTGKWSLDLVLDAETGESSKTVGSGTLTNFSTADNGQNRVSIAVQGTSAFLFVNNQYIDTLDVSALNEAGEIYVATGLLKGNEKTGETTGYSSFKVTSAR